MYVCEILFKIDEFSSDLEDTVVQKNVMKRKELAIVVIQRNSTRYTKEVMGGTTRINMGSGKNNHTRAWKTREDLSTNSK